MPAWGRNEAAKGATGKKDFTGRAWHERPDAGGEASGLVDDALASDLYPSSPMPHVSDTAPSPLWGGGGGGTSPMWERADAPGPHDPQIDIARMAEGASDAIFGADDSQGDEERGMRAANGGARDVAKRAIDAHGERGGGGGHSNKAHPRPSSTRRGAHGRAAMPPSPAPAASEGRAAAAAKAAHGAGREAAGAAASAAKGASGALAGGVATAAALAAMVVALVFGIAMTCLYGASSSKEEPFSDNALGPYFFWMYWETGCDDNRAFDSVGLDDGLGGQAYGPGLDLKAGSVQAFMKWALEKDPEKYSMFKRFSGLPWTSLYASSQSSPLPTAWHKAYSQDPDGFAETVKEFVVEKWMDPMVKRLEEGGYEIEKRHKAVTGSCLSYAWQHGGCGPGILADAGIQNSDSDEAFIKKLYGHRTAKYGNYGGLALYKRYEEEQAVALGFLAKGDGNDVVSRARSLIGVPKYTWGGAESPSALDCSGYVSYCLTGKFKRIGTTYTFLTWPRTRSPRPGDVCTSSTHCGIYIGNGQMLHCSSSRGTVVMGDVPSDMVYVRYPG